MGKGFILSGIQFMLSQGEGCGEDVRGNGTVMVHVKGTINHQLQ